MGKKWGDSFTPGQISLWKRDSSMMYYLAYREGKIGFKSFLDALDKLWPERPEGYDQVFYANLVWEAQKFEQKNRSRGAGLHPEGEKARAMGFTETIRKENPNYTKKEINQEVLKIFKKLGLIVGGGVNTISILVRYLKA
jgi:hypothetical protein